MRPVRKRQRNTKRCESRSDSDCLPAAAGLTDDVSQQEECKRGTVKDEETPQFEEGFPEGIFRMIVGIGLSSRLLPTWHTLLVPA